MIPYEEVKAETKNIFLAGNALFEQKRQAPAEAGWGERERERLQIINRTKDKLKEREDKS